MECLMGVAAAGGMGAREVFNYNRDNFMYDRRARLRKELRMQDFRVKQAMLWREDVRDLISLTEYKMHVYLLVNVLMLGFTVVLYCQGRLPSNEPDWLMMGFTLSTTGAFIFLLLSIWLAMSAAVAAQSYETRLLTQLVRLPIPSWQEIEACRTYGSDFERTEPRQMFRIPFVRQEKLVHAPAPSAMPPLRTRGASPPRAGANRSEEGSDGDESESAPGSDGISSASRPGRSVAPPVPGVPAHCDPWGLERRGDGISELGCKHGHDVAKLRHIIIARRAMTYWQTYDAFARVSLSIGANQLLLAMSYYIIGYIMVEVGCRSAAVYGVVLLMVMSETLLRLDMSLSMAQLRLLQVLLLVGPLTSVCAGYRWTADTPDGRRAAEALIVVSFFMHSMYLALMSHFCRIRAQDNGAMMPIAFRSILYLDAFGWLKLAQQAGEQDDVTSVSGSITSDGVQSIPLIDGGGSSATAGYYASDYYLSGGGGALGPDTATDARPALASVKYVDGKPLPRRPEDMAPPQAVDDLRALPGAPNHRHLVGGAEDAEFYSAASWLQGSDTDAVSTAEDERIIATGQEKEPGILPWAVFTHAMGALCLAWLAAAVYHGLAASQVWGHDAAAPAAWAEMDGTLVVPDGLPSAASMLGLGKGWPVRHLQPEAVAVSWPFADVEPRSLACDSTGQHFVISDGLSLYSGALTNGSSLPSVPSSLRQSRQEPGVVFRELGCPQLVGQGLQDVAVACSSSAVQAGACDALVLHHQGRRLAACPLSGSVLPTVVEASAVAVADGWLVQTRGSDPDQGHRHGRIEKPVAIALENECGPVKASANCTILGTTQGRAVRMRRHAADRGLLVPATDLYEGFDGKRAPLVAGGMRTFGDGGLGLLLNQGSSIHLLSTNGVDPPRTELVTPEPVVAFCIGGGHVYALSDGQGPRLWRAALPTRTLHSNSTLDAFA